MLPEGTALGILAYDEIFVEYDGAQIFSCSNKLGDIYIGLHAPFDEKGDNWLFLSVSPHRLRQLKYGEVSLLWAFQTPERKTIEHYVHSKRGRPKLYSKAPRDIPLSWFPKDGLAIDGSYIYEVATRIDEIDFFPREPDFRARAGMLFAENLKIGWEQSEEFNNFIKPYKTPLHMNAQHFRNIYIDLSWQTGSRHEIGARFMADQITSIENLLASLVDVGLGRGDAHGLGQIAQRAARLDARAMIPSSFSVRLELKRDNLFIDHSVVDATRQLFSLMNTRDNDRAIREILRHLGFKVARRYKAFIECILQARTDFRFEAGVPWMDRNFTIDINSRTALSISRILAKELKKDRRNVYFVGRITGISISSKYFRLESDGESNSPRRIYSGKIAETALSRFVGKKIADELYSAEIQIDVSEIDSSGMEIESYTLIDIQELDFRAKDKTGK